MASSLRSSGLFFSAARSSKPVSPSAAAHGQCRSFSKAPELKARGISQNVSLKPPAQPSAKVRIRTSLWSSLPQDIGLLPGTFIRPLWRDMPSLFEQPRQRLHMEWLWLKTGFQNFLGILAYSKWLNKGLPLRLRERRKAARELHQRMYTAFAAGDVNTIRKICCTGLSNSLSARIANRPSDERITWTLEKYNRTPATYFTGIRVVSDRVTQIPERPDSGVRQVVVRITSRQSTSTMSLPAKRGVQESAGSPSLRSETKSTSASQEPVAVKQQDCTEYIVFQKFRWMGEEEDWRIWGHTNPTTVEDLDSPFFAAGLTLSERLAATKELMEGRR
ncbi:hypothetical protein VTN00DRAFT_7374 [Thermoascus crustaceus]|uniref:uncharacterized protein n=1 Tax=Thermoascus crustaceus TaxID=5088 RepID=UPI003743254D